MMSQRSGKYIAVLFGVLFYISFFSIPAFAGKTEPASDPPGSGSPTSETASGTVSSKPGAGSSSVSREPEQVHVTLRLNGGTGAASREVPKGTRVSRIPKPARKGYRFAGWTYQGVEVSDTYPLYDDITLSAQWEKITPAAQASSGASAQKGAGETVDTHESEVERAAREAEQAQNDPDALSSQNWGALLTSSGTAENAAGPASAAESAVPQEKGGASNLLLIGILLVVAGAAGIGAFVYLQFFRGKRGRSGPRRPGGGSGPGDATAAFTDISSYSDGRRGHEADELHRLLKTRGVSRTARPACGDADWDAFFSGR